MRAREVCGLVIMEAFLGSSPQALTRAGLVCVVRNTKYSDERLFLGGVREMFGPIFASSQGTMI